MAIILFLSTNGTDKILFAAGADPKLFFSEGRGEFRSSNEHGRSLIVHNNGGNKNQIHLLV